MFPMMLSKSGSLQLPRNFFTTSFKDHQAFWRQRCGDIRFVRHGAQCRFKVMLRIYLLLFKLYPCMFILCCMNKSGSHRCGSGDPSISEPIAIGIPKRKDSTLPLDHMQSPSPHPVRFKCVVGGRPLVDLKKHYYTLS